MGSSTCWHDGYCNKEKKSTARFGSEPFCSSPPFRRPLLFSPLSLLKNALSPRTPRLDEASREELETRQSGRVRQTNSAYITKYGGRDSWRAVVGSRIHPRGGDASNALPGGQPSTSRRAIRSRDTLNWPLLLNACVFDPDFSD